VIAVVRVVALILTLLAGCAATPADVLDPPTAPRELPADCWRTAAAPDEAAAAIAEVAAGQTVCLTGEGLAGAELRVTRSGTPDAPITIAGDGVALGGLLIEADDVGVHGISLVAGTGIEAEGRRLILRDNVLLDTRENGITCMCDDAVIERNVVRRADGAGVFAAGDRILIQDNTISESVVQDSGDADGIRFFGTDVRILGNTITDIKDDGYGDSRPHTDCFQTYDNSAPATVDAVIQGNTCRNVDHQCLIATAEEAGLAGEVGRSRGIRFVDNVCEVEGSQAILIGWFPDVSVEGNRLAGPNLDRAVYFGDGSVRGRVMGNSTPAGVRPFQVDESSRPGFVGLPDS